MLDRGQEPTAGGGRQVPAPTLVRLTSSRRGVPEGEPLELLAEVVPSRPAPAAPSGTVAFRAAGRTLGESPLDERGCAVLRGVRLTTGVHALTATYSGDRHHAGGSSAPVPQAVVAPAAAVLVAVAAPTRTTEGVRLEAELLDAGTGRLVEDATGTIVFVAAGRQLGQAPLVHGQASVVVAALPEGSLRVVFPGDREHAAASGHLRVLAGS